MRKFLLLLLSMSFISSIAIANETEATNLGSDEDTVGQTTTAPAAPPPAVEEDLSTVSVDTTETKTVEPQPTTIVKQTVQTPIDIDGNYNPKPAPAPQVVKRPLTEADKMRLMRARLEKQNELLVRKQMERMRLKQEMEMSKRIQKSFETSMNKLEEVE